MEYIDLIDDETFGYISKLTIGGYPPQNKYTFLLPSNAHNAFLFHLSIIKNIERILGYSIKSDVIFTQDSINELNYIIDDAKRNLNSLSHNTIYQKIAYPEGLLKKYKAGDAIDQEDEDIVNQVNINSTLVRTISINKIDLAKIKNYLKKYYKLYLKRQINNIDQYPTAEYLNKKFIDYINSQEFKIIYGTTNIRVTKDWELFCHNLYDLHIQNKIKILNLHYEQSEKYEVNIKSARINNLTSFKQLKKLPKDSKYINTENVIKLSFDDGKYLIFNNPTVASAILFDMFVQNHGLELKIFELKKKFIKSDKKLSNLINTLNQKIKTNMLNNRIKIITIKGQTHRIEIS